MLVFRVSVFLIGTDIAHDVLAALRSTNPAEFVNACHAAGGRAEKRTLITPDISELADFFQENAVFGSAVDETVTGGVGKAIHRDSRTWHMECVG